MEWLLYSFLFMYATWAFYLAVMNLIRVKKEMPLIAKLFAYPLAFAGIILDLLLNIVIGSILFVQVPNLRHLLFTARLQEHLDNMDTYYDAWDRGERPSVSRLDLWRWDVAVWICKNLLDPFDSRGFHCRNPKELNTKDDN